jgi:hypothetical protein
MMLGLEVSSLAYSNGDQRQDPSPTPVQCPDGLGPLKAEHVIDTPLTAAPEASLGDNSMIAGVLPEDPSDPTKKLAFIGFRGTVNSHAPHQEGNWWQNLKWWADEQELCHGKHGNIHRGFHNAVMYNDLQIIKEVQRVRQLAGDNVNFLITGHSLGGGMANIATMKIQCMMPELKISLVTLGGPRVGDARFAGHLEDITERIYRVVNVQRPADEQAEIDIAKLIGVDPVDMPTLQGWDPVTQVPNYSSMSPSSVTYVHAGHQVNIGAHDGTVQLSDQGIAGVNLHFTCPYVPRIKQLALQTNVLLEHQICTNAYGGTPPKVCMLVPPAQSGENPNLQTPGTGAWGN